MLYASAGDEEHILYECLNPGETLVSKGASKVITFCDVVYLQPFSLSSHCPLAER